MKDLIIVTPVKDSLHTTKITIQSVKEANRDFDYLIYDDYSGEETGSYLKANQEKHNYKLIHLSEITDTPSPNYRFVLQDIQKKALEREAGVLLIESDVFVKPDTISQLFKYANELENCGMLASVTVDDNGEINFPYKYVNNEDPGVFTTTKRLSFCCTIITYDLLKTIDFKDLNQNKDWYDVFISKTSTKMGFNNYIAKELPVIHRPHSSRPWKNLKYENPLKYYFKKFVQRRDRI
ncbi:glycosyltransferase family 2 protein [Puteibacter caeruleilacunae]|nr:glycosyltransferase family 2 protein [Puteibacter caeruleilacunae]